MIAWLLVNWKFILLGAALLVASYAAVYFTGKNACEAEVTTKTVEKVITVKEKQNEIRNKKPTVLHTVSRLRNANF